MAVDNTTRFARIQEISYQSSNNKKTALYGKGQIR